MKKIFLIFLITFTISSAFAQSKKPDLSGTWKIILKTSGSKPQPPAEYLLLMDDSVYTVGVDSIGNTLPDVSSGRWSVTADGGLILFPSDRIAETRYYKFSEVNKYRYAGTKKANLKKPVEMLGTDIYLEKFIENGEK
jgi:hypothetical protein